MATFFVVISMDRQPGKGVYAHVDEFMGSLGFQPRLWNNGSLGDLPQGLYLGQFGGSKESLSNRMLEHVTKQIWPERTTVIVLDIQDYSVSSFIP